MRRFFINALSANVSAGATEWLSAAAFELSAAIKINRAQIAFNANTKLKRDVKPDFLKSGFIK